MWNDRECNSNGPTKQGQKDNGPQNTTHDWESQTPLKSGVNSCVPGGQAAHAQTSTVRCVTYIGIPKINHERVKRIWLWLQ